MKAVRVVTNNGRLFYRSHASTTTNTGVIVGLVEKGKMLNKQEFLEYRKYEKNLKYLATLCYKPKTSNNHSFIKHDRFIVVVPELNDLLVYKSTDFPIKIKIL